MKLEKPRLPEMPGVSSKTKLVLGAAGLLLFIIGVRKTFQHEGGGPPGERAPRPERETE